MKDMTDITGKKLDVKTKGILYLCEFKRTSIDVLRSAHFENAGDALNCYANIPNPESQLITAKTNAELIEKMNKLHLLMINQDWLDELGACL